MNDLAQSKARPLVRPFDMSGASLKQVVGQYDQFKAWLENVDGQVMVRPEEEAIAFYMANHAMSLVAQKFDEHEPLGALAETVDSYHTQMQAKALRMFFYLLLICTRESRHAFKDAGLKKVYEMYPKIAVFHKGHIEDTSADESVVAMLNYAPDVTVGEYVNFLHDVFLHPEYSGGYGGKAWRMCAFPLREMVWGRISAEMMLDTGFTLEHNGGTIFNKQMLYHNASKSEIRKILDVQRSGQIPQLVANKESKFVVAAHIKYQKNVRELIGGEFDGYVDWYLVESLGSLGKYPTEKQNQADKHGVPGNAVQNDKLAKAKEKFETMLKQQAADAFAKNHIEVSPGVFVEKIHRLAGTS